MRSVLLTVLLAIPLPAVFGVEKEPPPFPGLRSEEFIKADFDALLKRWAEFIEKNADSYVSAFVLDRIVEYQNRMADWRLVEPSLEKALASKLTKGFLSYAYKKALFDIYRSRGLRKRAEALNAFEGAVTDWFYIGAFGTEIGEGAVFETFEPENDLLSGRRDTLKKEYLSFDGSRILRWRRPVVHKPLTSPSIDLRTAVYNGVKYAVAQFEASTERNAVLRFSVHKHGYIKVFLNGSVVYEYDGRRQEGPSTVFVGVRLERGYNQILVKTTQNSIEMFVCDMNGFPLKGLKFETEDVLHPVRAKQNPLLEDGEYEKGLIAYYKKRYESSPDDVDVVIAYSLLLSRDGMKIRSLEVVEDALRKKGDDAVLCYFAANIYNGSYHCPEAWRHSKAKVLIEKALEKKKHFVLAKEMLADFLVEKERHEKAIKVLRELLEAGIRRIPIYRRIADICAQKSWVKEEIEAVKEAETLNPNDSWVLSYWNDYYQKYGNIKKAREYRRRYYELYESGESYRLYQAQIAEENGNIDRAIEIYQEFAQRYPESVRYKEHIAQLLERAGRYKEAVRYYEMLFEEQPEQILPSHICTTLGRLYRMLSRIEDAVRWYRRSLLFSPGDWSIRRYVQFLKGEDEDFSRGYFLSEEEVKKLMDESPTSKEYPRASVLNLLEEEVTLVLPSGATSSYTHTVEKLLKEEAKSELGVSWGWGEIKVLRTITPEGKRYEPTPMGYGFAMVNLCKGAFVEKKRRGDGYTTMGIDTTSWHREDFLSFYRPYHLKRIVIIFRKSRLKKEDEELLRRFGYRPLYPAERLRLRLRNFIGRDNLSLRVVERDDATVYIFTAKELRQEEQERATAPRKEIFPNMEFIADKIESGRSLCRLKSVLRDPSVIPTDLIREQALKITEGATTPIDRVKKLYEWCHTELKEGGYANYAHSILIERAGDRNVLFRAFLNALNIPYRLVVSSSRLERGGAEEWEREIIADNFDISSPLFLFEDEGKRFFVTLSRRYAPFGKIPEEYQGAPAFIVTEEKLQFIYLPQEPLSRRMEQRVVMEIDLATGVCKGRYEHFSAYSYERKSEYAKKSKDDLKRELEYELGSRFRGMKLRSFELPKLKVVGAPLIIKFVCEVPTLLLKRPDGNYNLNTFLEPLMVQRRYAGKPERKYPMKIYHTYINNEVSVIKLSKGYEVVSIPKTEELNSPFGFYSLSYDFNKEEGKIKVERYFAIYAPRIELEEYNDFLEFARRIDEIEMAKVVLKKKSDTRK